MAKSIMVTVQDKQRLEDCLAVLQEFPDKLELPHIQYLDQEVQRAKVVLDPLSLPADVITMRSRVKLVNVDTGAQMDCVLVYPAERAPEEGRISVLAPLGAAMLGYRVGDVFEAELPKGPAKFRVEAVLYQPESAGDYHL
ncbi:MAG TPA: GreA/GreB family elongation factor [Candidatus Hydrogenedentes bacterium]|nr:GreA/GreB family elongation factor [Candidatus Hydrogenedentota bacterium]